MRVQSDGDAYEVHLTSDERSAILWAVEVARASLLGSRDLRLLLAEKSVTPILLDNLADSLFLADHRLANEW